MQRRIFIKDLVILCSSIVVIPQIKALAGVHKGYLLIDGDIDLKKSLVIIKNGQELNKLNNEQLFDLYKYLNKGSFSSDFVPYSPTRKLKADDISNLLQKRYAEANLDYERQLQSANLLTAKIGALGAGSSIFGSILTSHPVAGAAISALALFTSGASAGLGWVASEYGSSSTRNRILIANELDFNNKILLHNANNNFYPNLKGKTADLTNITAQLQNHSLKLPETKFWDDIAKVTSEELAPEIAKPNDFLAHFFDETLSFTKDKSLKKEGITTEEASHTEQQTSTKKEPLTEQEIKERTACAENIQKLGSVLISKFAAENDQLILNTLFNTSMQYFALTALEATTLGPAGWTAVGITMITSLISKPAGGKFEEVVMKAFNLIFNQLQEMQKSLQRIEQRQEDIMFRLDEIYALLREEKIDLEFIKKTLDYLTEIAGINALIESERNNEGLLEDGLTIPMQAIDTAAKVIYTQTNNFTRRTELKKHSADIRSAFNAMKSFILFTTASVDFTGIGRKDLSTFSTPNGMKFRLFNQSSSQAIAAANINLYEKTGILSYIYNYYIKGGGEIELLSNPEEFQHGVINYIAAATLFPQSTILGRSDHKTNVDAFFKVAITQYQTLNLMAGRSAINQLSFKYLTAWYDGFYGTSPTNLLSFIKQLKQDGIIPAKGRNQTNSNLYDSVLEKFDLKSVASNLKNDANIYSTYQMPFAGFTYVNNLQILRFSAVSGMKFLRDVSATPNRQKNNFYQTDKIFKQTSGVNLLDLIKVFEIANINKLQNTITIPHGEDGRGIVVDKNQIPAVGSPFETALFELEFKNLPFLNGIKINFSDAKIIAGIQPVEGTKLVNTSYSRGGDGVPSSSTKTPNGQLDYFILTDFFHEISFAGTPGYFDTDFSKTWKENIKIQLEAKGRIAEIKRIPKFDECDIFEFLQFLIDLRCESYKNSKINEVKEYIERTFLNTHQADHISPSLLLVHKLNCTIGSKGKIPFNSVYLDKVFRIDDLCNSLYRLRSFNLVNSDDKKLFDLISSKEPEEKKAIESDYDKFDITQSLFYYAIDNSSIDVNGAKFKKLDKENFYDFLLIFLRYKILETYHYVSDSTFDLTNTHIEPCFADAILILDGYKNLN